MKEKLKENFKSNKVIVALIIGAGTLLVTVFGAAYAYFSVTANNNTSATNTTGTLISKGDISLTTNTSNLYLNLDGVLMNEGHIGTKYYATNTENESPIINASLGNGIYTMATASLASGDTIYDCNYNYDVTATLTTPINDGSDSDIKVTFKGDSITDGELTYTLAQILSGTKTLSGTFSSLTAGTPQTITVESTVNNTSKKQDDYVGNSYSISITPKAGAAGFSCTIASPNNPLSDKLISDGNMWQSGLEGDGYRFIGSGNAQASNTPDNFICFGTTDKSECTTNPNTYMYRIIGVFKGTDNKDYVKLIKYSSLASVYAWNTNFQTDISWESSSLKNGLNGSYFMTSTDYPYMQQTAWTDKIANWTWSAVNTKTYGDGGPDYITITTQNMYLHEMNRSGKTSSIGLWTTPQAKIGLMYASDYQMSLGASALSYTGKSNATTLKTGWMYILQNVDPTNVGYEWTISRRGLDYSSGVSYYAWYIYYNGNVQHNAVNTKIAIRPTFYLENSVNYSSGTGTIDDPLIIG